jgi:hypothetical protein
MLTIAIAVYTELIFLMMSSKPARKILEIIYRKIVHLVGSYYTDKPSNINFIYLFLWRFEPRPGHGLPLWSNHTHWTYHARYDSYGRAISLTQRTLLDDTQQSQEKNNHAFNAGFETAIPGSQWLQTHSSDRPATGIGIAFMTSIL